MLGVVLPLGLAVNPGLRAKAGGTSSPRPDEEFRQQVRLRPHRVAVHPSPDRLVAVGWRSPCAARVRVAARVLDADPACGNGVTWSLGLRLPDAQARRMVRDDRARGLATEFASPWLEIRDFNTHDEKSERHFPTFAGVRVGRGGGRVQTGRVLDYTGKANRQMCRLSLSMMDKVGVHLDRFGDAGERLSEV